MLSHRADEAKSQKVLEVGFRESKPDQKRNGVGGGAINHGDLDEPGTTRETEKETDFGASVFAFGPKRFDFAGELFHGGARRNFAEEIFANHCFWREAGEGGLRAIVGNDGAVTRQLNSTEWQSFKQLRREVRKILDRMAVCGSQTG
jgi:hypothetical protein